MSNQKSKVFYVFQPYAPDKNGGLIYGVGSPHDRPGFTTITGLSKNEANLIVDALNGKAKEEKKECPNCGEKAGSYSLGEVCNACHEEF